MSRTPTVICGDRDEGKCDNGNGNDGERHNEKMAEQCEPPDDENVKLMHHDETQRLGLGVSRVNDKSMTSQ